MDRSSRLILGCLAALTLALAAAGTAVADDTYWTNTAAGGTFATDGNWDPAAPAGSTTNTLFVSNGTYTVTFDAPATSGQLQITNSSPTFDLAGNTWTVTTKAVIASNSAPTAVTFLSTGSPGTVIGSGFAGAGNILNLGAGTSLTISNVTARFNQSGDASLKGSIYIISGTLSNYAYNDYAGNAPPVVSLNNSVLAMNDGSGGRAGASYAANATGTWSIVNGSTFRSNGGNFTGSDGALLFFSVLTNSTWDAWDASGKALFIGTPRRGASEVTKPWMTTVTVDQNSTLKAASFDVGRENTGDHTYDGNMLLTVSGGSTLTVSNSLLIRRPFYASTINSNTLVLSDSTINLGGGPTAGVLTNRGIMKASGVIQGLGSTPATVVNEQYLQVGNSIGTLTLSNANLELVSGSTTYFEFDPTTAGLGDAINITGGSATIDGALVFSTNAFASTIGFGDWDFLTADTITYSPSSDNLSNLVVGILPDAQLLGSWSYGVINLDGQDVLRLSINMVPEPSTVLLLVGGGLVLFRLRRTPLR